MNIYEYNMCLYICPRADSMFQPKPFSSIIYIRCWRPLIAFDPCVMMSLYRLTSIERVAGTRVPPLENTFQFHVHVHDVNIFPPWSLPSLLSLKTRPLRVRLSSGKTSPERIPTPLTPLSSFYTPLLPRHLTTTTTTSILFIHLHLTAAYRHGHQVITVTNDHLIW